MTIEERVAHLKTVTDRMEAVKTIGLFLAELEKGTVRAAVRDDMGVWQAQPWVKEGILAAFKFGVLAEFASGVTGVFESVKTATGYAGSVTSRDYCEVNGSDGGAVYELSHPLRVLRAGRGGTYAEEPVPPAFRKPAGSSRDADRDPYQGFRYDQDFEFVEAIHAKRPCQPSFIDGLRVQEVMAAIQTSAAEHRAVTLEGHARV